jgi:hypothetical protein
MQDLVMSIFSICVPRRFVPGDAALALGSSGATGPGVSRLYFLGSLGFLPPPINLRQVGNEVEFCVLAGCHHGEVVA